MKQGSWREGGDERRKKRSGVRERKGNNKRWGERVCERGGRRKEECRVVREKRTEIGKEVEKKIGMIGREKGNGRRSRG